ncbi:hypothetical protein D9M72_513110 [compost metagenome]
MFSACGARAFQRCVLRLECPGDFVLIARSVGFGLLRGTGQALVLVAALGEARQGLAHVFGMSGGVAALLGRDEYAVAGPEHAVPVGAQLEAFPARVLAPGVVLDARDVAQAELAVLVVALELYLDLRGRVVEDQMAGATCGAVAAFVGEFAAPETR